MCLYKWHFSNQISFNRIKNLFLLRQPSEKHRQTPEQILVLSRLKKFKLMALVRLISCNLKCSSNQRPVSCAARLFCTRDTEIFATSSSETSLRGKKCETKILFLHIFSLKIKLISCQIYYSVFVAQLEMIFDWLDVWEMILSVYPMVLIRFMYALQQRVWEN